MSPSRYSKVDKVRPHFEAQSLPLTPSCSFLVALFFRGRKQLIKFVQNQNQNFTPTLAFLLLALSGLSYWLISRGVSIALLFDTKEISIKNAPGHFSPHTRRLNDYILPRPNVTHHPLLHQCLAPLSSHLYVCLLLVSAKTASETTHSGV